MALTEQDFLKIITDNISGDDTHGFSDAAENLRALHTSECEKAAKSAFNAAKEKIKPSDFPYPLEKYRTYQDYKDALNS